VALWVWARRAHFVARARREEAARERHARGRAKASDEGSGTGAPGAPGAPASRQGRLFL